MVAIHSRRALSHIGGASALMSVKKLIFFRELWRIYTTHERVSLCRHPRQSKSKRNV